MDRKESSLHCQTLFLKYEGVNLGKKDDKRKAGSLRPIYLNKSLARGKFQHLPSRPHPAFGTEVVSGWVAFALLRNNPSVFMLCFCLLLSTGGSAQYCLYCGTRLKGQSLSGALLITIVEEKRALKNVALAIQFCILKVTHITSIHNTSAKTEQVAHLTAREPYAQKERKPEVFGNGTNH